MVNNQEVDDALHEVSVLVEVDKPCTFVIAHSIDSPVICAKSERTTETFSQLYDLINKKKKTRCIGHSAVSVHDPILLKIVY